MASSSFNYAYEFKFGKLMSLSLTNILAVHKHTRCTELCTTTCVVVDQAANKSRRILHYALACTSISRNIALHCLLYENLKEACPILINLRVTPTPAVVSHCFVLEGCFHAFASTRTCETILGSIL